MEVFEKNIYIYINGAGKGASPRPEPAPPRLRWGGAWGGTGWDGVPRTCPIAISKDSMDYVVDETAHQGMERMIGQEGGATRQQGDSLSHIVALPTITQQAHLTQSIQSKVVQHDVVYPASTHSQPTTLP